MIPIKQFRMDVREVMADCPDEGKRAIARLLSAMYEEKVSPSRVQRAMEYIAANPIEEVAVLDSEEPIAMDKAKTMLGISDDYTVEKARCSYNGSKYSWGIWVTPRPLTPATEALRGLETRLSNHAPTIKEIKYSVKDDPHMLEVSLMDHHFGKLAWGRESANDYDLKIASELYERAIEDLLSVSSPFNIDRIVLPFGHDFFHINDASEKTPKSQHNLDVEGRLAKIYECGAWAVVRAVERCLTVAPVDVVLVPGNHDQDISYFLAFTLKMAFRDTPNVTVDAEPRCRKYVRYGTNLIGMMHWLYQRNKAERLGLIMAGERKQDWAETTVHEWHLGHIHKKQTQEVYSLDEELGVRVRVLPSLTGTDKWHYEQGYVLSPRCAEAYLWGRDYGYRAHFNAYARDTASG